MDLTDVQLNKEKKETILINVSWSICWNLSLNTF